MENCIKCGTPLTTSAVCPNCGWSEFGYHDQTNLNGGMLSILSADNARLEAENELLRAIIGEVDYRAKMIFDCLASSEIKDNVIRVHAAYIAQACVGVVDASLSPSTDESEEADD